MIIEVEVDYTVGLPGLMTIVGLPDTAVQESRERVQTAIRNTGLDFPRKRVVVNLAPASVRKEGPAYDLPIALEVMVLAGYLPHDVVENTLIVGELSLDGLVRHTRGVLPMAAAARAKGYKRIIVAEVDAAEAALIPDLEVIPVKTLAALFEHLSGRHSIEPYSINAEEPTPQFFPTDFAEIKGQEHVKRALEIAADGIGDALRVMIDRAGQRAPTPDYPIADAMLQVMVPLVDGTVRRKGVRINYVMPPASPYGDTITLRISNYRTASDLTQGSLALLCQNRLPPVPRPKFDPKDFPRGNGILTPEAANYLLSVMVHGGTLVIAGTTGSGKTFVGQRILQEMLDYYPRGAIRLFIVEDSNEIILNGWNGDGKTDTGNIIYTVTRPEIRGGPPPVTMYDLIRSALRSRPHGVVIGEARGAEAWELIRAAATGHGHSAFTIHATSAEHVWPRFLQVVQAHPDAARMSEVQIAQSFAEAITAAVYIERNPQHGQIVREIVEVSTIVERTAARPSFSPLFRFEQGKGLLPTGNRPMRPGFRATDLNIPESIFKVTL